MLPVSAISSPHLASPHAFEAESTNSEQSFLKANLDYSPAKRAIEQAFKSKQAKTPEEFATDFANLIVTFDCLKSVGSLAEQPYALIKRSSGNFTFAFLGIKMPVRNVAQDKKTGEIFTCKTIWPDSTALGIAEYKATFGENQKTVLYTQMLCLPPHFFAELCQILKFEIVIPFSEQESCKIEHTVTQRELTTALTEVILKLLCQ